LTGTSAESRLAAVSTPAAALSTAASLVTTSTKNLSWRSDLDPRGLPNTDRFTASQRAILEACVELFGEVGYAATSVRDIASLVGIKSASLYKSFASKQAMLDALSELGHEEFSDKQVAAVMDAGDDAREQLSAAMRALVLMTCRYPRLVRIVNGEVRNLSPTAFERDQAARLQSARILRDVLDRGRRTGVFTNPDDDAITVVFWSLGVALSAWFPYAYGVVAEEVAESYVDISLRIVGAVDGEVEPEALPRKGSRKRG
jgi:AcrR family transcriptional regulator